MDIGQFIKTRRLELKFSQRQVALNSELSNATISRIESGAVLPDAATLSKIAKALKLNPSLLFKISGYIGEPSGIQEEDSKTAIRLKPSRISRSFGARLRELREIADYSREEFYEAAGYDPAIVKAWEAGTEPPDTSIIQEIADFFGVTASYLTGKSDVKVSGPRQWSIPPKKKTVLRETEAQDIREALKELSRAVANAQKVLAAYSQDDKADD